MPIWIRYAAHEDQLGEGWTDWQLHPLELIPDENGVRLAIITKYAKGQRNAELLIERGDFSTMARRMMASDAKSATAAFSAALAEQYPLKDAEGG